MNLTLKELVRIFSLDDDREIMAEVQNLGISLTDKKGDMKTMSEVIEELLKKVEETEKLNVEEGKDKKLKGYMFDSLVYRFKDAQSKSFMSEVEDYKYERACSLSEAKNKIELRQTRDLMRFIEILDEAIGEHD